MNFDECLRAEFDTVSAVLDAVAPELAERRSWVSRVISFLSCVVA